jgi:hypothetical protein
LCQCLPDQLRDDTFAACLKEDKSTKHWLTQLLKNLDNMNAGQQSGGGSTGGNLTGPPQLQQPQQQNLSLKGIKLPGGL